LFYFVSAFDFKLINLFSQVLLVFIGAFVYSDGFWLQIRVDLSVLNSTFV